MVAASPGTTKRIYGSVGVPDPMVDGEQVCRWFYRPYPTAARYAAAWGRNCSGWRDPRPPAPKLLVSGDRKRFKVLLAIYGEAVDLGMRS